MIDLATMLLLTRFLIPSDFGLVALAMSVMQIVEAVTELPVYQVLVRVPELTRYHYDTAFTLALIRGLILTTILGLTAAPIAYAYGEPRLAFLIGFLTVAPAIRSLSSPRMAEYQRQLSFWRDILVETSGKIVALAVAVGLAVVMRTYWAIPAGSVALTVAATSISYVMAPYQPRLSLREVKLFLNFMSWSSVTQIISTMNWQFERLLLGKVKSPSGLGVFTTANDFSSIPFNAIFQPIGRPIFAAFSLIKNDQARLISNYQTISNTIVAIGLPLVVGESLLSEPIIRLLLNDHWQGAAPLMRWLSLSLIPAVFAVAAPSLILAFDEMRVFLQRSAMEFCIKLPIAVVGAIEFGFWGVIVARVISEVAVNIYSIITVKRLIGLSVTDQIFGPWRSLASTCVMVPMVLGCLRYYNGSAVDVYTISDLIEVVGAGVGAYCATSLALWSVTGRPAGPEAMALKALRIACINCWHIVV
jgi:PST family polysaccharide transporter